MAANCRALQVKNISHSLASRYHGRLEHPRLIIAHAKAEVSRDEGRGNNVGEFCSLDVKGQRIEKSLAEKETEFLESMMSDEEFEALKDELIWGGSKVAVLSSNEQRFLEATMSFNKGKPMLTNEEYDALKMKLKEEGSSVVEAGPRCSIRSKRTYSDASPDYLKLTLLNLPAAAIVLGGLFVLDSLSNFNFITQAIELPPPWSILFLWGIVLPSVYVLSASITNLVLPDALILSAPCPNCGAPTQAYFGGIFNIADFKTTETEVECSECKADLLYKAIPREVVMVKSGAEKQAEREAKIAARKKA